MIKKYAIPDADGNLPGIIGEVESGTTVHLTRDGDTVAVVMSLGEYHRLTHGRRPAPKGDLRAAIEKFRAETDLEQLNIEEIYADIRDPWPGRDVE